MRAVPSTGHSHGGTGAAPARASAADHLVRFYENDHDLAQTVAQFLGAGLEGADRLLVIATAPHHEAFRRQLESRGFDVAGALESGKLTSSTRARRWRSSCVTASPTPSSSRQRWRPSWLA